MSQKRTIGNKIWIGLLSFCVFVFIAMAFVSIWMGFTTPDIRWKAIWPFLAMTVLAARTSALVSSRIKYGPKGPPPDPLKNFHVDF